jgi:hypothetical protein
MAQKNDVWLGLGVLGVAALIINARRRPQASVEGLGFIKKARKALKKVASPVKKVVKTAVDPRKHIAKVVQTVSPSKPQKAQPAAPGQEVEYQDEHGNVISEAEYNRLVEMYQRKEQEALKAAQGQQQMHPARPPAPEAPADTTDWGMLLRQDAGVHRAAVIPASPAPSAASAAAPPPAKINPLLTIGTLIAVPVVMGVLGDS